jgi:hypothetical protein
MSILRKNFYILGLLLPLIGCATQTIDGAKTTKTLPVNGIACLHHTAAWPLQGEGRYLQNINADIRGERHKFSVHLTLENQKLEAIAFNEIYGRLYHLIWTPEKISWKCADALSDVLRSENIIADFLIAHLPADILRSSLVNADLQEEETEQENIRLITLKAEILRRVSRHKSLGYLWENVRIQNPEIGYELDIQTVVLP